MKNIKIYILILIVLFLFVQCEEEENLGKISYLTYSIKGDSQAKSFTNDLGIDIELKSVWMITGAYQAFFGDDGIRYSVNSDIKFHSGHPHTLKACKEAGDARWCGYHAIDLLAEKNILKTNVKSSSGLYTKYLYFILNYSDELMSNPEAIINQGSENLPDELKKGHFLYIKGKFADIERVFLYKITQITHLTEQVYELDLKENTYAEIIFNLKIKRWFNSIEDFSTDEAYNLILSRVYFWTNQGLEIIQD